MQVLKITAEGLTASFRYPHFMMQVQPTFDMPPPATLYGHVASALGEWFDPQGILFAVHFSYRAKQTDIETIYLFTSAAGRKSISADLPYPKAMEGQPQPFERQILFFPTLTLYLTRPEWADAFRSPRYAVCLGRSQDLFTYRNVEVIELQTAPSVYFQDALLPYQYVQHTQSGQSVLMPRWLNYQKKRQPNFARYLVIKRRTHTKEWYQTPENPLPDSWWADPTEPLINNDPRGVCFLSWV